MQTHITPQNKLASFGTIGLLFLAGIAGIVLLATPAFAAPAVTLSAITPISTTAGGPTELTGVTAGTVGSSLTLTGTGFASNSQLAVYSTVGTSTVLWYSTGSTCAGTYTTSTGGNNGVDSLVTPIAGATAPCLTTTSVGSFKSAFTVPALPGGAETITVTDGTNTVSVPFTITPKISFKTTGLTNYGFPEVNIGTGTFTITGFGAGESVTVATTAFTAATFGTPSCTTSTVGSCSIPIAGLVVADTTGGAKAITATGATSGLTASTTYTIKPWAAFYNSNTGATAGHTTFSFVGTAPTSLLIEVHGMSAGTIAAGTITVGGISTSHAGVTIGSSGAVGGTGGQIVISPTANVPFGNAVVVVGGVTFSYANGNIAEECTTVCPQPYGGALISSIAGTAASTGVVSTDAASYKPAPLASSNCSTAPAWSQCPGMSKTNPAPPQNQIGYFGYGFVPSAVGCGGTGGVIAFTAGAETYVAGTVLFQAGNCEAGGASPGSFVDTNGAFFMKGQLSDTPWSSSATPTTAATYTPSFTQTSPAPANTLNPSFGITPWVDTSSSTVIASTVDYTTIQGPGFTVHGFGATDIISITVGGQAPTAGSPAAPVTAAATSGGVVVGAGACPPAAIEPTCTVLASKVPDLAAGPQNLVASGSITGQSVTSTGAITYEPFINGGTSTTGALSINSGSSGSTTILRTGTSYGVHGLYASTQYSIVWNAGVALPGQTGTVVGTFTSTATGGIPVPGVQFTIPADTAGIHIIDLQRTSTIGTSFIFSNNLESDYSDPAWTAAFGASYGSNYGDMLFNEGTSLVATPTVANVGGTVSITGTGLAANTLYDLGISQAGVGSSSPAVPSTCALTGSGAAGAPTTISGAFTSTSTGTVPPATSVVITDQPTASGLEQGTLYCIFAQTASTFGTTSATGVAQFELQASENLNMTSAPIGHNVQLTAHALNANSGYNVLFAPYSCGSSGAICGTVVGAILSNAVGQGSGTFTVPGTIQTAAGASNVASGQSYVVELQKVGSSAQAIASPATIAVSSVSTTCNTTSCLTANGAPTTTQIGANKAVQTSFTNNSPSSVTAIVYAVVHNAAGQTVAYSTATLTNVPSGGSATAYDVLFGLAPGTYSVTIFATSTSGTAISGTSTVTVTI